MMGALAPLSPWLPEDDFLLKNAVEVQFLILLLLVLTINSCCFFFSLKNAERVIRLITQLFMCLGD